MPGQRGAILGQIVVELVMNVYRHAFAGRTGGTITVELGCRRAARRCWSSPTTARACASRTGGRKHFGFTIVRGLAKGLDGRSSTRAATDW